MSNNSEIRCPYCLTRRKMTSQSQSKIKCLKCSRQYSPQAALAVDNDQLANISIESRELGSFSFSVFLLILITCNLYVLQNTAQIKGEPFIVGYVIFGFFCILLSRLNIKNIKLLLFVLFESIAIVRLYAGFSIGMSHFGFLFFAMIIGGILIWVESLSDTFNNSNSSSDSGSSDGGCGGGGGCGGCG